MGQILSKLLEDTILVESKDVVASVKVGAGQSVFIKHHDLTDAARVFTAVAATDLVTVVSFASDKYPRTGLKVRLTTTGTLPAGLALATDYFAIQTGTNGVIKLASSLANAQAGTAIDITDAGTGTHTITPVSGGARTLTLSFSNDGVNFSNVISLNGATATTYSAVTLNASAAVLLYDLSLYQNISHVKLSTVLAADGQARLSFIVSCPN